MSASFAVSAAAQPPAAPPAPKPAAPEPARTPAPAPKPAAPEPARTPAPAPKPATPAVAPVPTAPEPAVASASAVASDEGRLHASTSAFREKAREYFKRREGGAEYAQAQSLDVANEALQILGQIVADRASGAALEQLVARLRTLLGCSAAATPFPRTCAAIAAVRLTDLAGSGRALLSALLHDTMEKILAQHGAQISAPVKELGLDWIGSVVLPELLRAAEGRNAKESSTLIVKQIMEVALQYVAADDLDNVPRALAGGSQKGRRVLVSVALAFADCVKESREKDASPFDRCPIVDRARYYAQELGLADDLQALFVVRALAADVLDALTLRREEAPDWNGRVARGLNVLFATTCLLASGESLQTCPAVLPKHKPKDVFEALSTAHFILSSALDRDVNGVLVGAGLALDEHRKGLRLLGGVLRYAQTYTDGTTDSKQAHERRVELLEDLTSEMTDRTGREGDAIWSFGGALQFVGGARIPLETGEDAAVYGPIGLPLGVGFQTVGGGFHLALGIVDLGQYVSWQPGVEVAEPSVEDALAPSVTVGYAWGKSFPAFVGLNSSYAPHYRFSENTGRGSLNLGVTGGVYVPLFDLN